MLTKLTIKNVALIEQATILFNRGLNVLSGETGAGKSVILDSLNFVLGAKADKSMIRYGESECMVKAEFFVPESSMALQVLEDLDIDSEGDIIISRRFSDSGKSSIKINGSTVTASMLRRVTDHLVDVHGQSEHFFLLSESNQMKTLDGVAGVEIQKQKDILGGLLSSRKQIKEQLGMLGGDEKERSRRMDVLRYQIDEINAVDLKEGEEEELLSKRNKFNNMEKIIRAFNEAQEMFAGESGIVEGLRRARRSISAIAHIDSAYEEIFARIESISIDVTDVAENISDLSNGLYFDEEEANYTESRLDAIRALKNKYGANKEEIDRYLEEIEKEYALLSDCDGQFMELTSRLNDTDEKIYAVCQKMTTIRKSAAQAFCDHVVEELKSLNIGKASFEIEFKPYTREDVAKAGNGGLDEICFMFSANAGEPLKPLGKIISGGEMSRFMLAIKTRLSDVNGISTYVFDEIDAGISGKTAKVVGEKFARISKNTQIIAVSHLAQIAAMSDCEYLIEKKELNGKTLTNVLELDEDAKRREIARLLGGDENDAFAIKHAEELIKQANEYKSGIAD